MAKIDDKVFGKMNAVDAGTIMHSEYEDEMNPTEQGKYEAQIVQLFQDSYRHDPHKGALDFKHWLKTLNTGLVEERALKWEDIRASGNAIDKLRDLGRLESTILEDAGLLQRLSHLHTGRVRDLIPIVESVVPEEDMMGAAFNQQQAPADVQSPAPMQPRQSPMPPQPGPPGQNGQY